MHVHLPGAGGPRVVHARLLVSVLLQTGHEEGHGHDVGHAKTDLDETIEHVATSWPCGPGFDPWSVPVVRAG